MGYLEGPLSLNPSDREPKTTIVTRVMLGTVLTTATQLALPPRGCGLSGARTLVSPKVGPRSLPRCNEATFAASLPQHIQHKLVGPSQRGQCPAASLFDYFCCDVWCPFHSRTTRSGRCSLLRARNHNWRTHMCPHQPSNRVLVYSEPTARMDPNACAMDSVSHHSNVVLRSRVRHLSSCRDVKYQPSIIVMIETPATRTTFRFGMGAIALFAPSLGPAAAATNRRPCISHRSPPGPWPSGRHDLH